MKTNSIKIFKIEWYSQIIIGFIIFLLMMMTVVLVIFFILGLPYLISANLNSLIIYFIIFILNIVFFWKFLTSLVLRVKLYTNEVELFFLLNSTRINLKNIKSITKSYDSHYPMMLEENKVYIINLSYDLGNKIKKVWIRGMRNNNELFLALNEAMNTQTDNSLSDQK